VSSSPQTLGSYLKQEREKRGITIEQISSATKISVKTLIALEEDHYADLPAKPFIRGFIQAYCRCVGIDPQECLTKFGIFIEQKSQERPNKESGHTGYAFEKKEGEQNRTVLWIVMLSFLVLGSIAFIILKPSLKHHKHAGLEQLKAAHPLESPSPSPSDTPTGTPSNAPTTSPSVISIPLVIPSATPSPVATIQVPAEPAIEILPSPTPSPKAFAKPTPLPSPTHSHEPHPTVSPTAKNEKDLLNKGDELKGDQIKEKVLVKSFNYLWVRYKADDKPITSFVMKKDVTLVIKAAQKIYLQFSNPKSVQVAHNSKKFVTFDSLPNAMTDGAQPTLAYPHKLKSGENPLAGEKALPKSPDPVSSPSTSETH
jgi:cytoskeleton protein RodZ